MALDLSKLQDYTRDAQGEHLTATIMEADTVKHLNSTGGTVMVGVKYQEAIPFMDGDVTIQSGEDCGRNPIGNTSFDLGKITVVPLKSNEDLCPKKLEKKWLGNLLRAGQEPYTEMIFANQVMALKANKISVINENMLWSGDTESDDVNLNKFDGFIKLYGEANMIDLGAGATLTEQLQNALLTVPTEIKNAEDFYILLSHEDLELLNLEKARANYFDKGEESKLFGTSARLVAVKGLQNKGQFWFGRSRSYVVGTDLLGEIDGEGASMEFSNETKKIYLDFYYALGANLIFKDELKVFKKASTPVAPEGGE
ncbi:hypothetical protein [Sphingobacterium cellulitidis]|uniref:Major capsid protein n=1 Tax=Sphingobacterium cellulitidis TaxID=1768011 RepID=A0A8H9G1K9_9SPHI|nr:hypothetical protein [Sphingobacterium soli]MBA8985956.1 hypothetical protein [Sphingobacterium soli]GGE28295.1 hypothetical protein GCM10011516_27450 [Sphingobacterium soli]